MKIEVEKIMFDNNEGVQYKIVNIDKCCDEILNNSDYVDISGDNYIDEIENYLDNYNVKIKYCPFCGEKIEIVIVNTVDKNEEYNKLQKERDTLNDKRRNTDSKKEEQKLNEEIKELDNKINAFYESDGFDDYLERIGDM